MAASAPKISYFLQTQLGVNASIVMVSPYLEPGMNNDPDFSPMNWVTTLPSMTAANYERQGKTLSPAMMKEVEDYTRGEFVTDLMKGRRDPAAVARIVDKVTAYTGLDHEFVQRSGGRIDVGPFCASSTATRGWSRASVLNVTQEDPFPWAADGRRNDDPRRDHRAHHQRHGRLRHPASSALEGRGRFNALSYDVGELGEGDRAGRRHLDLRKAIAADPKMKVLIAHGYDDLSSLFRFRTW